MKTTEHNLHTPHTETLPCGLRIVSAPSTGNVVYCGMAVNTGTRDELAHESGMAHFCEHMTFKGTHNRRSWHILNRMECVGGDLNAYTGKEETIYYSAFLKEHFGRAVDLLFDITLGSTYPQNEMNKEVEVVIDEIESYNDSPSELIFDEFENLIFNGHTLGRNILGEAEQLRKLTGQDMQEFALRTYHPRNMVFFVYGDVAPEMVHREAARALKKVMESMPAELATQKGLTEDSTPEPITDQEFGRIAPTPYTPKDKVVHKNTHQAHVLIGTRCYGAKDSKHIRLYLLNNILGGPSMNSRLNLSLREKNGLVYTVESNMTCYTDTGVWSIYFGCDKKDVSKCKSLVLKELKKLTDAPLSEHALATAKRQIKGQIGIANDNSESVGLTLAKTYLHYHKVRNIEELFRKIDALTAAELHETAVELFAPEKLTTLIYK